MEKTIETMRGRVAAAVRVALAAVLAIAICVPAQTALAGSEDANDAVVRISSHSIEGGDGAMNEGVGYATEDGTVSYCYDARTSGPGAQGQDYSDFCDGTHATDYLLVHGYPSTNEIGGVKWSDADAQGITQLATWIVADTKPYKEILSFQRTSADKIAAAEKLAFEANTYKGGDPSVDRCSSIAYCEGKPGIQPMLTGSLGGRVTLTKTSGDAKVTAGDDDYSLEGAEYGVYKDSKLVAKFTTDADGHGQTDRKLKNGTYTVKETAAPAGYMLSEQVYEVTVAGKDATVDATDTPITVKIAVVKTDAETGQASPQGAGSLDGAVYRATYEMGGKEASQEATVSGGEATFEGVPLGKISVTEIKAPAGYLLDTKAHEFVVTAADAGHEAAVFELAPENGEFAEQPVRGDLELVKIADSSHARLAGVPFKVTSKTTGENHVIVTDANGYASTAASWNRHTADTNGGNDGSGIWFGACAPDDSKGALLYDTYTIEEQRCDSNADKDLIPAFDVTVYKDSVKIDLGTVVNFEGPKIGTTATDGDDEDHEAVADEEVTINDVVTYTNLTPGREYKLTGKLMDKATGEAVVIDGKKLVSEVTFTPSSANGSKTVTFKFNGVELSGHDVVVFEGLTSKDVEIAAHADINDEGQTVKLVAMTPEIKTTATDADDGDHEASADSSVIINDEVSYSGLTPGKEYTLTGTLMDKETGKPVQIDGKDLASTVAFTPAKSSGAVTVTFEFDGSSLDGHDVVVFERLRQDGIEVASHADIDDEGQTVKLTTPDSPEQTLGEPGKGSLPKTGENLAILPIALSVVSAACGASALALTRRRSSDDSDSAASDNSEVEA